MFNISKQARKYDTDYLKHEMRAFGIVDQPDTTYQVNIGDELVNAENIEEVHKHIEEGITELKGVLWEDWQDLSNLAFLMQQNESSNSGSLDNLVFLSSAKNIHLLSTSFSQISEISDTLLNLFNVDIADINEQLISKFNQQCLTIELIHYLIMREQYRVKLIHRSGKMFRHAQISGPWANLDLPMKERVWEYGEDEEYFDTREKSRKEQTRYNPETNKMGYYYVWQDLTRDPYLFEDMKTDSPYKSRHLITLP